MYLRTKVILIVLAVVLIAGVLTFLFRPWEMWMDDGVPMGQGNTVGNARQVGSVTQSGDWIYVAEPTPSGEPQNVIYRTHINTTSGGGERIVITQEEPLSIFGERFLSIGQLNVVGDWFFFSEGVSHSNVGIYRIRRDGTRLERLSDVIPFNLIVLDGWIYYFPLWGNYTYIYRMRVDGTDYGRLSNIPVTSFDIVDEWIYYSVRPGSGGGIYRMRTDGTEVTHISSVAGESITVHEDWIFYVESYSVGFFNWIVTLYRMNRDGSNVRRLTDSNARHHNISGDWIFYADGDNDNRFYRMRLDGSERGLFRDASVRGIFIAGDWIYYSSVGFPGVSHRMRMDGTNHEALWQ